MSRPSDRSPKAATRLLKGAALLFAAIGGSMAAWGLDKWIRYPEMQARQFGMDAPLWPAFTLFVLVATIIIVRLLWRTAGRVEQGEDLFSQRHRRRPSDSTGPSDRPHAE